MNQRTSLSVWKSIVLIFFWLGAGILGAIVGNLLFKSSGEQLSTTKSVLTSLVIPHLFGLVFILYQVRKFGIQSFVFTEKLKVKKWVWIAPLSLLAASIIALDWQRLMNSPLILILATVCGTILIASSEEIMFRGIQLNAFREKSNEFIAMILSTFLFALSHMINTLSLNPLQVMITFFGGYIFYLTKRVSGGLIVPILLHTFLDFSLFSITLGPGYTEDNRSPAILFMEVAIFVIFIVLYPKMNITSDKEIPPKNDS